MTKDEARVVATEILAEKRDLEPLEAAVKALADYREACVRLSETVLVAKQYWEDLLGQMQEITRICRAEGVVIGFKTVPEQVQELARVARTRHGWRPTAGTRP